MVWRLGKILPVTAVAGLVLAACSGGDAAAPKRPVAEVIPVEKGGAIVRLVKLNSWYHAALVDPAALESPRELEALGRAVCETLSVCRVGVWYDQFSMPNGMPVSSRQLEAQEFAFGRATSGTEAALWNCDKYPEFEAEEACLPRLMK